MHPEIHIGPLTLQTFGLMFALAFIVAGAIIHRRLGELDKPQDWAKVHLADARTQPVYTL